MKSLLMKSMLKVNNNDTLGTCSKLAIKILERASNNIDLVFLCLLTLNKYYIIFRVFIAGIDYDFSCKHSTSLWIKNQSKSTKKDVRQVFVNSIWPVE